MVNDAANKSHVDGVKQAATYLYLYVFCIYRHLQTKLVTLLIDIWSDGKAAMATGLIMVNNKILHLATPIDANDALNK